MSSKQSTEAGPDTVWQTHKRAAHIWAVTSISTHFASTAVTDGTVDDLMQSIVLTKAYFDRNDAEAEASRLNDLNADRRYFVLVARLQKPGDGSAGSGELSKIGLTVERADNIAKPGRE